MFEIPKAWRSVNREDDAIAASLNDDIEEKLIKLLDAEMAAGGDKKEVADILRNLALRVELTGTEIKENPNDK